MIINASDFPYVYALPDSQSHGCLSTRAAQGLVELWRSSLYQLAITFHGGMQAIAYEWGSPRHYGGGGGSNPTATAAGTEDLLSLSPDDNAQREIAEAMSDFAGSFVKDRDGHRCVCVCVYVWFFFFI